MKVTLTGATGNMGREALFELVKLENIEKVKILVLPDDQKRKNEILKNCKDYKEKIEVVIGNLKDFEVCEEIVKDVSYVINLAAVIPPKSDKHPNLAIDCNQIGVKNLVKAIEQCEVQPKLIHTSTVALYGNRTHLHPWATACDPLLISPLDIYSITKLRGEFAVLESEIKNWAVLRQTAMLHTHMLADNMSDGLMFHTCFNAPLEWVTAHDSGVLIANIIKKDSTRDLGSKFWKQVFNIGSTKENKITGFQTLDDGFKLIGGNAKDFFKPYYNATRNFHGVWFEDGQRLNEMFDYISQDMATYWAQIGKKYWYYKFGKIVPKSVIAKFAIKRLFKDDNSPAYWYKHNDIAKLTAFFGSKENYENLPKNWEDFNLYAENKTPNGESVDFEKARDIKKAKLIDYGYDIKKKDSQITKEDLMSVAKMHGGRLLSRTFETGDIYKKLKWETQDKEVFEATAFSVLRAGHWHNCCYESNTWDFDRLAKNDKIYAQVWLDSHSENENNVYSLDENFNAQIRTNK